MKFTLKTLFFLGLLTSVFTNSTQKASALTAAELKRTAESITVKIEVKKCNNATTSPCSSYEPVGSGVIVASSNNHTYYVLTANHVVRDITTTSYRVIAPNNKSYPLYLVKDAKQQPVIKGSDLAFLAFDGVSELSRASISTICIAAIEHNQKYGEQEQPNDATAPDLSSNPVFCKQSSDQSENKQLKNTPSPQILVAGYPDQGSNKGRFLLTSGLFVARGSESLAAQTPLAGGYEFIYTNPTEDGMSGGPILDTSGHLIGIHGQTEGDRVQGIIYGWSLGIPIDRFLAQFLRSSLPTSGLLVDTSLDLPIKLPPKETAILSGEDISACPKTPVVSADVEKLLWCSNLYYRLNQLGPSSDYANTAMEVEPSSPLPPFVKGLILLQQATHQPFAERRRRTFQEAHESLEKAIESARKSNNQDLFVFLRWNGVVLNQLGEYKQAVDAFDEAIKGYKEFLKRNPDSDNPDLSKDDPEYFQAWAGEALALDKLGKVDDAKRARAIGAAYTGYEGWLASGIALYELAKQELQPSNSEARRSRLNEALESFERAIALVGPDQAPEALIGKSRVLNKLGEDAGAEESLKQGIKLGYKYSSENDANGSTLQDIFEILRKTQDLDLIDEGRNFFKTLTDQSLNKDNASHINPSYVNLYYLGVLKYIESRIRGIRNISENGNDLIESINESLSLCEESTSLRPDYEPSSECIKQLKAISQDIMELNSLCHGPSLSSLAPNIEANADLPSDKFPRNNFPQRSANSIATVPTDMFSVDASLRSIILAQQETFRTVQASSGSKARCTVGYHLVNSNFEWGTKVDNFEFVQEQNWP